MLGSRAVLDQTDISIRILHSRKMLIEEKKLLDLGIGFATANHDSSCLFSPGIPLFPSPLHFYCQCTFSHKIFMVLLTLRSVYQLLPGVTNEKPALPSRSQSAFELRCLELDNWSHSGSILIGVWSIGNRIKGAFSRQTISRR